MNFIYRIRKNKDTKNLEVLDGFRISRKTYEEDTPLETIAKDFIETVTACSEIDKQHISYRLENKDLDHIEETRLFITLDPDAVKRRDEEREVKYRTKAEEVLRMIYPLCQPAMKADKEVRLAVIDGNCDGYIMDANGFIDRFEYEIGKDR